MSLQNESVPIFAPAGEAAAGATATTSEATPAVTRAIAVRMAVLSWALDVSAGLRRLQGAGAAEQSDCSPSRVRPKGPLDRWAPEVWCGRAPERAAPLERASSRCRSPYRHAREHLLLVVRRGRPRRRARSRGGRGCECRARARSR